MTIVSGTCSDRAVQVCLPVGQKLKITLNDKCGYIECFSIPQLFAEKKTVRWIRMLNWYWTTLLRLDMLPIKQYQTVYWLHNSVVVYSSSILFLILTPGLITLVQLIYSLVSHHRICGPVVYSTIPTYPQKAFHPYVLIPLMGPLYRPLPAQIQTRKLKSTQESECWSCQKHCYYSYK